jgi:CoA:oxalate CoA-transferase
MDLGARVIKIERPDGGDLSRRLYLSDTEIGGDSTIFHAINRAKESLSIDLKDEKPISHRCGPCWQSRCPDPEFPARRHRTAWLDYEAVRKINPRLVYASISGYGEEGPWVKRPGQDLLAQSRSGVMWLNGDEDQGPVPFGLAVGDMLAGAALAQGILAALVRRSIKGTGSHVETSLLEALVDFQFEVLTTHLNDGRRLPKRANFRSAHAYLSAPYGVYAGQDGYLAIAMTPIPKLADLLGWRNWHPTATTGILVYRARRDQGAHRQAHRHQDHGRMAGNPRARRHLVRQGAELERAAGQRRLPGRSTCCRR